MKRIQFNKNNIIRKYSFGMESVVYLYKNGSDIVLLKLFNKEICFDDKKIEVPYSTFENKRKKIEIISESKEFEDEVKILDLVYDGNLFIGYTMPILKLKKFDLLCKRKERLMVLNELRKRVDKYNNKGIYIGDFKVDNIFITEDGRIILVDLDNFRIGNLDFDLKSFFQLCYLERCDNIENIDNYSFNLFTVSLFGKVLNSYVWENINEQGLPRALNTKENRDIIDMMRNPDDTYEKRYLIDNIRKF